MGTDYFHNMLGIYFMKNQQNTIWNPPETMPKDKAFLADVGQLVPVTAIWNQTNEWFWTCTVTDDRGPYFAEYCATEIKGWLPLPVTSKGKEFTK